MSGRRPIDPGPPSSSGITFPSSSFFISFTLKCASRTFATASLSLALSSSERFYGLLNSLGTDVLMNLFICSGPFFVK